MRTLLLLPVAALCLSSCDNPKSASKDHFAAALNQAFKHQPLCLMIGNGNVIASNQPDKNFEKAYFNANPAGFGFGDPLAQFDALTAAGFYDRGNDTILAATLFGQGRAQNVTVYTITKAGQDASTVAEGPMADMRHRQFCYGTLRVKEIADYTEPTAAMGSTISEVRYTTEVQDRAKWSEAPAILSAFPTVATSVNGQTQRAVLVLTNDGWRDSRDRNGSQ